MKTSFSSACCLVLALACVPAASAATTILTDNVNVDIPDGSITGLARNLNISGTSEVIMSVEIALEISASPGNEAFIGDLYVYLTNGTERAVLLNRPGRDTGTLSGYDDNQTVNVTFSGSATKDIHFYRQNSPELLVANRLFAPLTGNWLPDGRSTDPSAVVGSDATNARLDVFDGVSANKDWTLFVADLSSSGQHRLVSWTLTVTTVPEASSFLLSCFALPLLLRRRR